MLPHRRGGSVRQNIFFKNIWHLIGISRGVGKGWVIEKNPFHGGYGELQDSETLKIISQLKDLIIILYYVVYSWSTKTGTREFI